MAQSQVQLIGVVILLAQGPRPRCAF